MSRKVDRGVKHARFAVIRLAQVPAVLIEGGFVSSDTEARQIATPAYRQELAEAIVTGIEGFKTLAEHKIPPKLVAEYRHETDSGASERPDCPGRRLRPAPRMLRQPPAPPPRRRSRPARRNKTAASRKCVAPA